MKKSAYNHFVEWEGFHCGVNLLSGTHMVILDKDYTLYENECWAELQHTEIYPDLIKGGFLIEEDEDEFARLIHRRNDTVFTNNNRFQLTVLPTLQCNFRCWYCYETHTQSRMTPATVERVKRYIDHIFGNTPLFCFHLDWFGGEPLLHFRDVMLPLSEYVLEHCRRNNLSFIHSITTNGYLIDDAMIERFREIELSRFQITLDGSREHHDKVRFPRPGTGSYSRIVENINKLCSSLDEVFVNVRINYTNDNIEGMRTIVDDIAPENRDKISICMQRVWQTREGSDNPRFERLAEGEAEAIREKGTHVQYNTFSLGQGARCYADCVNQSVVNYDGSLFKCTARNFADPRHAVGQIGDDGAPIWNRNYYKHFLKPVFDNDRCRKCAYVPACLGVCSQKYIESGDRAIAAECSPQDWDKMIRDSLLDTLYDYLSKQIASRHDTNPAPTV